METPIGPPDSPTTAPFSSVKQEEDGEPVQRDPRRAPTHRAVQQERVQGLEAAKASPKFGWVKQNCSGESGRGETSNQVDQGQDVEAPGTSPEK